MPTQCSGERGGAGRVDGRQVAVDFDGGQISSDAGALLLRDVDRTLRLTERVAACFQDGRNPELIEHSVRTLVMQRIVAIALGYEDLNDHDQLRRDPVLATLAGKLAARRKRCEPLAGKSTLNQLLEHFRNAGVGLRVVGHMLGIIAFEERAHRLYAFGRACRFGQNALKQFGYAASYEFRICRERMCGKAGFRKGIVRCLAEVGYGVEKSAVEVEDYERFHVS